jgi:hypothetical protein
MTNTTTTKTDRYSNRAPKGGAVSPVNGQWYAGGQWMPMVAEVVEFKPAVLEGSSRQVMWANRLRKQAIANVRDEIAARLLFLDSPIRAEVVANRKALKGFLVAHHGLMTERSAAAFIERRIGG